MKNNTVPLRVSRGFLAVFLVAGVLFLFRLGDRGFRNPDEGRYAEIAREMVVNHNWVEPTLYGVDYLRKPVLFYWLLALSFKFFGMSEFTARIVPAFFGFLGVIATYFFALRYWGQKSAFFSALILVTNVFYLKVSQYLLIDAVFAFFIVAFFYSFYIAFYDNKPLFKYLCFVFLGLAFLAKGVAAVVIPGFVLLIYFLISGKLKEGAKFFLWPAGIFISFAIAAPWFVLISIREPEFLNFFFWHEHVARFVSKNFEHQEPWYFYLALLPLIFFPWSLFVSPFKKYLKSGERLTQGPLFYLGTVFFGILTFYTLSHSKLATYLLPTVPFVAILLGDAWASWTEGNDSKLGKFSLFAIVFFIFFIAAALFVISSPLLGLDLFKRAPAVKPVISTGLLFLMAESIGVIFSIWKRDRKTLFYSLIVFMVSVPIFGTFAMEVMNPEYSTKHFAQYLKPKLGAGDEIFIYSQPGAFYDFAFYLNHSVRLVGLEGELEFNNWNFDAEKIEMNKAAVTYDQWENIVQKQKVYSLMRKSDYEALKVPVKNSLKVLMQDKRKVLLESGEGGLGV